MKSAALFVLACTLAMASFATRARACPAADKPRSAASVVQEVGFDQKLGDSVPLDLAFVDESGEAVTLGRYFHEKPVVLIFAYSSCPMLCTQVLTGFVHAARTVSLAAGRDFEIVTVSIDPREEPAAARAKKEHYLAEYAREGADRGWHALTGSEASIRSLAKSAGFRYLYLADVDEYAHASGFLVLTPEGRIAKYFYGVEFSARDLRLALVEASSGGIGSFVDQVLLLCYHYDPTTGKYGLVIMNVIRLLGSATVLALGGFVVLMLRRERLRAAVNTRS